MKEITVLFLEVTNSGKVDFTEEIFSSELALKNYLVDSGFTRAYFDNSSEYFLYYKDMGDCVEYVVYNPMKLEEEKK